MDRSFISPVCLLGSSCHVSYSLGNKYVKKKPTSPIPYGAIFSFIDCSRTLPISVCSEPKYSLPGLWINTLFTFGASLPSQ